MNFKKGPAWQIFLATSVLSLAALFPPSSFLSRPSQDFYPDIPRGKKELIPQAWVISETNVKTHRRKIQEEMKRVVWNQSAQCNHWQ